MSGIEAISGVLRPVSEAAASLLEKLLGEPCQLAGGILADQIYVWQWRNRISILHKAQAIVEKDQIAAKVLPPGFLLPLIDAAGNVDEDELQSLWAGLLASAIEDSSSCNKAFVETLRVLGPSDVKILRRLSVSPIVQASFDKVKEGVSLSDPSLGELLEEIGLMSSEDFWESVSRLQGIGLVNLTPNAGKPVYGEFPDPLFDSVTRMKVARRIRIRVTLARYGARLIQKSTRQDVSPVSVTDSWTHQSELTEMAVDANVAAMEAMRYEETDIE
ncbi:DUF4393 domain-containing protein [Blastopirellula sp. J2-11]|uniref:DUF4393 domain-containing protein n=1 Tax=Blastopirellula sp. J2-11 TaxID=2943192 RepID=UPI0021C9AFD8|nr:DUF4393 domain-containing protein [Blastopirellula sp. J2-11]UUO06945.1 DUF4393 domain-containing protein [Blastopirellula sp. J2-11]